MRLSSSSLLLLFVLSITITLTLLSPTNADITWPEYNQQCRDGAGPPFPDDEETFNGGFYHDGSAAEPILESDGSCPPPLTSACSSRPTKKAAYIEGPIDCGDKGWYCRIYQQEGWPNVNLRGDYNFGLCNSTENFDDAGADKDGHCHGSSRDNTYYWWMRDHWHRGYNGRLRCCCGWESGSSSTPLTIGRVANRCDYRRLVTKTEDLTACRDANEDHGKSYEGGCDSTYQNQIGSPIPESDDICWEISKFGYTDGPVSGPTPAPTGTMMPSITPDDNDEEGDDDDYYDPKEDVNAIFTWKRQPKNKKLLKRSCGWLQGKKWNQKKKFCTLPKFNLFVEGQQQPASQVCFETCANFCVKQNNKLRFYAETQVVEGEVVAKSRNCNWLKKQSEDIQDLYCAEDYDVAVETVFVSAAKVCTNTCASCDKSGSVGGSIFG